MKKSLLLLGLLALLTAVAFAISLPPPSTSHAGMTGGHHTMAEMSTMPDMVSAFEDRLYSEFNHRLVGAFFILVGLMVIAYQLAPERAGWLRDIWPLLFIAPGIYIFVKGDPDGWPMGASFAASLGSLEWLQHKLFALLLIAIGLVEQQHSRGGSGRIWIGAFVALALVGAGLTLVHHHREGHATMTMPGVMDSRSMALIQAQHIGFVIVGLAMIIARWLSGTGRWKRSGASFVWPSLFVLLALQLIFYRE